MPIGGKLVLKGGATLKSVKGVEKKKKKKKAPAEDAEQAEEAGDDGAAAGGSGKVKKVDPTAVNIMTGNTYEKEFEFETQRMEEGKTRSTPWGSSYRAPPQILHGYDRVVKGVTAEERLDLRCAKKADKFCK